MSNKGLNNFLKTHADKIWSYWEENHTADEDFIDEANKIGTFHMWFKEQRNEDLAEITKLYEAGEFFFSLLRKEINSGVDAWFDKNPLFLQ